VAKVWEHRQDVRLIFPGTRHPNPAVSGIPTHNETARVLVDELGLRDKAVYFGDWVAYDDWQNILLECDLALTLHGSETLESRLAFRSRVLDYIWAGLPTVATSGDAASELIVQYGLGLAVKPQEVEMIAEAILRLLDSPREAWRERFDKARQALNWERVAQPLIEFCRAPRAAPDKVVLGERLGNPFYVNPIKELREDNARRQDDQARSAKAAQAHGRPPVVRLIHYAQRLVSSLKKTNG
jgi:glycosyltransferase involved in cell wall biosynthesis